MRYVTVANLKLIPYANISQCNCSYSGSVGEKRIGVGGLKHQACLISLYTLEYINTTTVIW